ncbi:MAG: SufB/SufD family protein, partial [bacterium]
MTEAKNFYQERFEQFEKGLADNGRSWALPIRRAAISRFVEMGFPTPRHEEWKYTNVAPIAEIPFRLGEYRQNGLKSELLANLPFGSLTGHRLVFVNGRYSRDLSSFHLPDGVRAESLGAAMRREPRLVEPYLGRHARYQDHPFVALNTAFMEDGAFVSIPGGKIIEEPIHLFFISTAHGEAAMTHPRNLIWVGNDSQATIVESYVGLNHAVYWNNAVTEVVVGENAVVDHSKLQWESEKAFHLATLQVHQERSSNFVSHSIALGGSLVRNEINAVLDGEGAECTLNGLYFVAGRQHVDNHTRIDHVKPHCTSRELYKGVLGGNARGVFNGKIYV